MRTHNKFEKVKAYESYDLIKTPNTPRCVLFRGFYTFLPRYDGVLSSNNPMLYFFHL